MVTFYKCFSLQKCRFANIYLLVEICNLSNLNDGLATLMIYCGAQYCSMAIDFSVDITEKYTTTQFLWSFILSELKGLQRPSASYMNMPPHPSDCLIGKHAL